MEDDRIEELLKITKENNKILRRTQFNKNIKIVVILIILITSSVFLYRWYAENADEISNLVSTSISALENFQETIDRLNELF